MRYRVMTDVPIEVKLLCSSGTRSTFPANMVVICTLIKMWHQATVRVSLKNF
jgi:hypothetical protein